MTKEQETIDMICRALLMIVSALRRYAELPAYKNTVIEIREGDSVTPYFEEKP